MWCPPDREREFVWWYRLVPVSAVRGRSGGRASLTVYVGFVWSGYFAIHFGGYLVNSESKDFGRITSPEGYRVVSTPEERATYERDRDELLKGNK